MCLCGETEIVKRGDKKLDGDASGWTEETEQRERVLQKLLQSQWYINREEWSVRRRREQRVSHLVLSNMIEIMQCILPVSKKVQCQLDAVSEQNSA